MEARAEKIKIDANHMYLAAQGSSPPPRPLGNSSASIALQKAWDKGTEDKTTGKIELPYPDVKGATMVSLPAVESRQAKLVPIAPSGRGRRKSSRIRKTKKTGRRSYTRRR
jgi:hypothetical protein